MVDCVKLCRFLLPIRFLNRMRAEKKKKMKIPDNLRKKSYNVSEWLIIGEECIFI